MQPHRPNNKSKILLIKCIFNGPKSGYRTQTSIKAGKMNPRAELINAPMRDIIKPNIGTAMANAPEIYMLCIERAVKLYNSIKIIHMNKTIIILRAYSHARTFIPFSSAFGSRYFISTTTGTYAFNPNDM